MPDATFRPAPATDSTRRTASVTGSRAGSRVGRRSAGRSRSAPVDRADAPAFGLAFAPDPLARAAVLRLAPAAAVFLVPEAGRFAPEAPLFFARDAPAPSARFSLRLPGRDRGRFPITPESSLTSLSPFRASSPAVSRDLSYQALNAARRSVGRGLLFRV
jgi:hypothetical protein